MGRSVMATYRDTHSDARSTRERIRALADRLTFVHDKTVQKELVHALQLEIAAVQKLRRQLARADYLLT